MAPVTNPPDSEAVLEQLERVLATPLFQHSKRYPAFLRYIVEQTLRGAGDELKERTLGIAVFRRSPTYDTSADPVVRNTASEVRKRLGEYYSEVGHQSELRISLPAGGYVPEFLAPSIAAAPISAEQPGQGSRRARWVSLAVGSSAILLVGIAVAIALTPRKSPARLFWDPILQAPGPVLVVTDTLVALRGKQDANPGSGPVREVLDPKVFLSVNEQSAQLASFLLAQGKRVNYELARNVTLARLRERPFILRGAFNNQWTQRAVAPFRFYFQLDRDSLVRRIIDRQNPEQRHWQAPMTPDLTEDYALIARATEPETGQMMVVIAGLSEKGSEAALEFVTNPKYIDRLASQAPSHWERRNIELVIKSNLVNGEWGEPRIVASHFW
ncbi:MAG: hypothetical protein ACJ746_29370 [Bryobacteraceae bacterium]